MATKRQIAIAEHFINKETKKLMNENIKIPKKSPFRIYMPSFGNLPDNHATVTYDHENFIFKIKDDSNRTTKISEKGLLQKLKSKEYILESAKIAEAPNIDISRLTKANSKIEGTKRIVDSIINTCQNFKRDRSADINDLVNFINTQLKTLKRL